VNPRNIENDYGCATFRILHGNATTKQGYTVPPSLIEKGDGTPTQELVTEFLYPKNHLLMVAGQECPLCHCGTIEETATEYKCCGECGNIWNKPESTPQVILLPSVDGIDHALGLIPPVGWEGDMDALNQKVLDALDKVKATQPEDWTADDLYPLLKADGFRAANLLIATIWD